MSVSTGTRKERNVQTRSNESIIEADKEFINSLKPFGESNSVAGLGGAAINNSPNTPAGNYLAREGDSMIGPIALGPPLDFRIEVDANNTIDIGPLNENPQYSSNIQLDDLQPNSSVLDIIANAAFDGQILILRTFAPTVSYTISQATLANGGNIQTGDSNDLTVGDLQTVVLIFDASLIVFANTGGTWRVVSVSSATGGGGGSSPPFVDTTALVMGSVDATKLLRFEVDGFTTTTTRVMTPPNQDTVLAGLSVTQAWTGINTFTGTTFNVNTTAINLGDAITDNINFLGRAGTSLVPITNSNLNLGVTGFQWNTLWIDVLTNATTVVITSPIFAINSASIVLGDAVADNINFLGQIATEMVIEEIVAPGTPPANTLTLYGKLDGGFTKLFYKQEDGTEVGPLASAGAGSQTPWLSNIAGAGFFLQDAGGIELRDDVTLPASGVNYIAKQTVNLVYNSNTTDGHLFTIDGTQQFGIGVNINNSFNELDMNTNKVTDAGDPTDPQDLATKAYVDSTHDLSGLQDANVWITHETTQFDFEVYMSNSKDGGEQINVATMTEDTLVYVPFFLSERSRLVRMGVDVFSAAPGGTFDIAYGIYANRTDGQLYPGTKLQDETTVFSGTGPKTISIIEDLEVGLYWLAVLCTTDDLTVKSFGRGDANSVGWRLNGTTSFDQILGYVEVHTSTTLPTTPDDDMVPVGNFAPGVFAKFNLNPN